MDATACNYDATAEQDNGSCTYAAAGSDCDGNCLLNTATLTMTDSYGDGGGEVTVGGATYGNDGAESVYDICIDLSVCSDVVFAATDNWSYENSWSITDADGNVLASGADTDGLLGSCVTGCTDETATNYNADSDISDNTLCEYALVQGCMDATACNFDGAAEQDNGSCTYAAEGFDCEGNCLSGTLVSYTAGSYAGENSFTISDCDGVVLAEMTSGTLGFNSCVELGENYSISLVDSYGDGWNGGSLSIGGVAYTVDDDAENHF